MSRIQILHTFSSKEFAEAFARGLEREGYPTFWDPEGPMGSKGLDHAVHATCVVILTRDVAWTKFITEPAKAAAARDDLVEVRLDPVPSLIEGSDVEPIDFADWDGTPSGPQWTEFMARVLHAAGRPTGRLPLKEEGQPALIMAGLTIAVIGTLGLGGLPDTRLQNDPLTGLSQASLAPSATPAIGGPQIGAREPASAVRISAQENVPPVTAKFDLMEPSMAIQIIPLKELETVDTDVASADTPATDATDKPAEKPNT